MADQPITLNVPQHIYEQAQQIANRTNRSLEDVLLQESSNSFLPALSADEEAELNAMNYLSDAVLWTISRETMPVSLQEKMQQLMDLNTQGKLDKNQLIDLNQLVEQSQQLMLRKGKAASILTERGHTITREDLRD